MTTTLKMMSNPMAPYMGLMKGMTREQKLTVMAYLVDTLQGFKIGRKPTQPGVYIHHGKRSRLSE